MIQNKLRAHPIIGGTFNRREYRGDALYLTTRVVFLCTLSVCGTENSRDRETDRKVLCQSTRFPSALAGIWASRPKTAGNTQSWKQAWWHGPGVGVSVVVCKGGRRVFVGQASSLERGCGAVVCTAKVGSGWETVPQAQSKSGESVWA